MAQRVFAGARFVFGCRTTGADAPRSDSVVVFIMFLLDRVAVVTIHRSGLEKLQVDSLTIRLRPHQADMGTGQLAGWVIFHIPDKTNSSKPPAPQL